MDPPSTTIHARNLLTQRQRRNKRHKGHKQRTASLAVLVPVAITTLCVTLLVVTAIVTRRRRRNVRLMVNPDDELSTTRRLFHETNRNAFPERLLDIWPTNQEHVRTTTDRTGSNRDDTAAAVLSLQHLQSIARQNCLPSQNAHCRERKVGRSNEGTTQQQSVAILRPPGVLGQLLQDYVLDFVEASRTDDMDMVIQVHSAVLVVQDYTLTQLIRTTVVPLILHAMDVVLETVDVATEKEGNQRNDADTSTPTFTATDLTIHDVVNAVRLLIRWHCHVSSAAAAGAVDRDDDANDDNGPTALYTLNLHDALARPQIITRELASFLHVPYRRGDDAASITSAAAADPQDVPLNLNGLAETMISRLDDCTRQLQLILERDGRNNIHTTTTGTSNVHVESLLEQAMRIEADQCRYDSDTTDPTVRRNLLLPIQPTDDNGNGNGIPLSRVTQLVSSFLGDGSSLETCRIYPRARLCHTPPTKTTT